VPRNYQKNGTLGNIVQRTRAPQCVADRNIQHPRNNPNPSAQNNIAEFLHSAFNYLNHRPWRLREVPQRNSKEADHCWFGVIGFRTASTQNAATLKKMYQVSRNNYSFLPEDFSARDLYKAS